MSCYQAFNKLSEKLNTRVLVQEERGFQKGAHCAAWSLDVQKRLVLKGLIKNVAVQGMPGYFCLLHLHLFEHLYFLIRLCSSAVGAAKERAIATTNLSIVRRTACTRQSILKVGDLLLCVCN